MKILGLAGWSGSGKTTLIAELIPALNNRGLSVSTIKHAHHTFDIDHPGKDSHKHRESGAQEVLVSSARRWALIHENRNVAEPDLTELIGKLSPVDLVLVEGFKHDPHPKIEVYRSANGKTLLAPDDPHVIAIALDTPQQDADIPASIPKLPLDDVNAITDFIIDWYEDKHQAGTAQ